MFVNLFLKNEGGNFLILETIVELLNLNPLLFSG